MSTFASQAERAPSWKDEVNQRLAAHKNRKGPSLAEPARPVAVQHGASSMAAQAAARVAARYAKAPSYSEMLADEARAAVRAAEAASRAALHAQAAAESILAGLEAASDAEAAWKPAWEPEAPRAAAPEPVWESPAAPVAQVAPAEPAAPALSQDAERPSFGIRWEQELPARPSEPAATHASRGIDSMAASAENWWESSPLGEETIDSGPIEIVEPAQPIHANLIEFPREIVAPRKARPRLAEGSYAAAEELQGQLSIFEVDPAAVYAQAVAAEAVAEESAPAWSEPVWSGIELDAQPLEEPATQTPAVQAAQAAALEQAPMGVRLMAAVVDATLIVGAFLSAVAVAATNLKDLPGMREMEVGAVVALLTAGLLYQVLFSTLGEATPGMKYAHLSLCTFDGQRPTRAQRCGRLGALLLSLLPIGLGVAWALFDEGHLSWHDRLSKTYLRKYLA